MKHHVNFLLDADLDEVSVDFLLHSIERPIMDMRVKKVKELGIDFPHNFRFLEVLEHHEGIIQKEFASRFNINQSTVTRSLNALEKQGLIKRIILEDNKKNKVIRLTDDGRAILAEMHKFDKNLEKEMLKSFSNEDIKTFKKHCIEIAHNISNFSE